VHSSTSSFRQLPHGWFSLLVGGVLALALLAGWEIYWRARGFVPTLTDAETLWCHERSKVGHDSVVIVGSSRLQTGIDPALLSKALGGRQVIQLAINGANQSPTLHDLAYDESFAGVVVLEYMPLRLFSADANAVARAQGFVTACRGSTLTGEIDSAMSRVLQRRLVFMNAELHPITILSYLARNRGLPHNSYSLLRLDRFLALSFDHDDGDGGEAQSRLWGPEQSPDDVASRLVPMRTDIDRIRARGGRVVLYRPPVTKGILSDEEAHFPAQVWLPKAGDMLGVPTVDFAAIPEIQDVKCPDGGHIAATDVPRVTDAVARVVRGLLAR
jgi:hypothetical protein